MIYPTQSIQIFIYVYICDHFIFSIQLKLDEIIKADIKSLVMVVVVVVSPPKKV